MAGISVANREPEPRTPPDAGIMLKRTTDGTPPSSGLARSPGASLTGPQDPDARPASRRSPETPPSSCSFERAPRSATEAAQTLLSLQCSTNWEAIEAFRQFVDVYARDRFTSQVAERIGTATQELLENAANYCSITSSISYELRHLPRSQRLEIVVSNDSVPRRIEALMRRIDEMRARAPQEVYEAALRSASSALSVRAMLGLARVRFEAEMELSVVIDGSRVTVVARGKD